MKKTIRDVDVRGKRVLVRVDFNVPLDEKNGRITDDSRVRAALPTIKYLVDHKAKVLLCSHLGRPDGKVVEGLRMGVVAESLSKLMGQSVATERDCIGQEVEKAIGKMKDGDILLLENLRFHKEEEENDPGFSQALANLADIYVNDAFGTAHRAHASTVGVTKYLPSVAGFLMEQELEALGKALMNPARPFCSIVGGAKVSDKLDLLNNFISKIDCLLVGGGMSATFLMANGINVGKSLVEEDKVEVAVKIMEKAKLLRVRVVLPSDVIVADSADKSAVTNVVPVTRISEDKLIADIGPETVKLFTDELSKAATVLWNGPMGIFELPPFAGGTRDIATFLAGSKAITIIGGGSTAEAVYKFGVAERMTHVSTGGGASLMYLEGKVLPGVAALQDK